MNAKKHTIIYAIIFIILVVGIILGFINLLKPNYPDVNEWYKYKVKSGDTLWNITPLVDGYDIRDLIHVVKVHNNLSSSGLETGDVIELPVWSN